MIWHLLLIVMEHNLIRLRLYENENENKIKLLLFIHPFIKILK
jgi:hypothetical protein